jgi:hypothetical protein
LPQAPQLLLSTPVSTQVPPQRTCEVSHWHAPPTHSCPPVQTLPQPLQLALLVCRLTQAPLQFVRPGPHCVVQLLWLQTCIAPHTLPQALQLS